MRAGFMNSGISYRQAVALALAAGLNLAVALPAFAQSAPVEKEDDPQAPAAETDAPDANDPDMKDIDVSKLDWTEVNVDASSLRDGPAPKAARSAGRNANGDAMSWSANNKGSGASAVSVKQSVSPIWDARVGADMTVTSQPTTMSELLAEKTANGGNLPQSGGTAWASITAPGAGAIWDKTAVEARVDPAQDQSKLGTTIVKSVPLSDQYSLTLQNGYNVTQQGIVPLSGVVARPTHNYQTDQSAKLSIGDTGTSVIAGQTLSSNEDKWLRKVGAEQKVFDGVSISGSIGETAEGATSKSISAGFKHSW
jgi:hypothetical protein